MKFHFHKISSTSESLNKMSSKRYISFSLSELFLGIIIVSMAFFMVNYKNDLENTKKIKKEITKVENKNSADKIEEESFNNEEFLDLLVTLKVEHPEIVYSQAVLETNNFSSNIFVENNNLFGMKHPRLRNSLSLGENRGHARYDNWRDSVIDYLFWQMNYASNMSTDQYINKIGRVYAEDPNYLVKVVKISETIQNSI